MSISQPKGEPIAVIKKTKTDDGAILLDFFDGNARRLAQDICQAWERTTGIGWEQKCKIAKKGAENADSSNAGYTNTIGMNTNGELVALQFLVLPGVAPMQISLAQRRPLVGSD